MYARSPAHHVARGRKTLQMHDFPMQTWGSAITLILSCESKFPTIKIRVSTHSACRCKNYLPECSQIPKYYYTTTFLFLEQANTLSKKIVRKNHIEQL
jgi:hypothetical protein